MDFSRRIGMFMAATGRLVLLFRLDLAMPFPVERIFLPKRVLQT
jgi:hypothetical protein